jgi:hypothetical protein
MMCLKEMPTFTPSCPAEQTTYYTYPENVKKSTLFWSVRRSIRAGELSPHVFRVIGVTACENAFNEGSSPRGPYREYHDFLAASIRFGHISMIEHLPSRRACDSSRGAGAEDVVFLCKSVH